ncbi:MAG TPA: Crp/Fnr family transcriptional regulator [Flavobacteriales bacterium]|nr:Crp/Fnr family transcriptional regulator [Flavobacteriales bacterium]HCA82434.1 Crp/Fnr family transcriptional regulator [Flavobacteriales bacterium]HRE73827.1 Crp/Fnr family transcriptional regulator [Flavobacteriales bacterium]HRJ35807.1 Crp/Fnr family transcriptional regulator [Flavobacteriales bacterium]HRJ38515.1 Crp/Fnr family transcriptional regulator [Flavobacteriales bacterium]
MSDILEQIIRTRFKQFNEDALITEILEHGALHTCTTEEQIINPGAYVKMVPLLVYGSIRISRQDEEGREIYLYHLYPGQTCAISLNCCMSMKPSEVLAIAEDETEFISIPVQLLDEWTIKYKSWRNFMFETYRERFHELIQTIDNIAFHKLDERLVIFLNEQIKAGKSKKLHLTHQQIAQSLGSSREVISRLLKQLERDGKVKLGRNEITMA